MGQQGCGSGSCGCGGGEAAKPVQAAQAEHAGHEHHDHHAHALDPHEYDIETLVASVNGVPLHGKGESPDPEALRQRAYSELLRQAAQRAGLLAVGDEPAVDGVLSEAASQAIEQLLEREIQLPEPDEAACRRYFEAHHARFSQGERVRAAHILFAVTPGVDVEALRKQAEGLLVAMRCADDAAFAQAAAENSNCPSAAAGGELGWLARGDCAPEFAAALFAQDQANAHVGVLPHLISTRFGFHLVRVEAREPGALQPFSAVHSAIAQTLRQQGYITAMRQYLNLLAGAASLAGVELDSADSPLVQ
jgi:peptidyl-prolyl cis-trans isomerase C